MSALIHTGKRNQLIDQLRHPMALGSDIIQPLVLSKLCLCNIKIAISSKIIPHGAKDSLKNRIKDKNQLARVGFLHYRLIRQKLRLPQFGHLASLFPAM